MTSQVLFSGQDVELRHSDYGGDDCFVTFTSVGTSHQHGFGEEFLSKRKTSAFYFISKWDHWWQPAEVRVSVELAKEKLARAGYKRVVSYGASMGAYGAALHASDVGADTAVLIAPQFSIDPKKPPFERRWVRKAEKIDFLSDDMAERLSPRTHKIIIYDPLSPDAKHIDLFCKYPNVKLVPVHFGGHLPGRMLQQTGLLQEVLSSLLDGRFEFSEFRVELRKRRSRSAIYWSELGSHAQLRRKHLARHALMRFLELSPGDGATWLRVADLAFLRGDIEEVYRTGLRAAEIMPDHPAPQRVLSRALSRLGQHEEAISAAKRAINLRQRDADLHRVLLEALMRAARYEEAISIAREATSLDPSYAPTFGVLAQALEKCDRIDEAVEMASRAASLAPNQPLHAKLLVRLRERQEKHKVAQHASNTEPH